MRLLWENIGRRGLRFEDNQYKRKAKENKPAHRVMGEAGDDSGESSPARPGEVCYNVGFRQECKP